MSARGEKPRLLVSTPIEDRLKTLEARAQEIARWEGDDCGSVRSIRLCVAEVQEAMRQAEEVWHTTERASMLTGWSEGTLTKYAGMQAERERLPHEWRLLESRPAARRRDAQAEGRDGRGALVGASRRVRQRGSRA